MNVFSAHQAPLLEPTILVALSFTKNYFFLPKLNNSCTTQLNEFVYA